MEFKKHLIRTMLQSIFIILMAVVFLPGDYGVLLAQDLSHDNVRNEERKEEGWIDLWVRIQKIRMNEMRTALKLDDATMERLAPQLIRFDTKKREIGKERLRLLRQLKRLKSEKGSERELTETLMQIEANQAALDKVKRETKAHLEEHLTVAQQAEYIFFQRKFDERLRDLIQKERGGR